MITQEGMENVGFRRKESMKKAGKYSEWYRDAAEWGEEPTEGWEKFTSDLAEKMKEQYEIQMKE